MNLLEKLKVHFILMRPFAVLGIIPPFLLGIALSGDIKNIDLIFQAFLVEVAVLFGCHYENSYTDYLFKIDTIETTKGKPYTSASAILPSGRASKREVLVSFVLLYGVAFATSILWWLQGHFYLSIIVWLGILISTSYNWFGKRKGLGEVFVFLTFGVLTVLYGYFSSGGSVVDVWKPLLVSIIPGILWKDFYTLDQYMDAKMDKSCGVINLAIKMLELEFKPSRYVEFGYMLINNYHLFLILIGVLPAITYIAIISSLIYYANIMIVDKNIKKGIILSLTGCFSYVMLMVIALFYTKIA